MDVGVTPRFPQAQCVVFLFVLTLRKVAQKQACADDDY